MLQKAGVIARPRAARIDQRRASAAGEPEGIDAEGRAAPIDVRVQVDEAGRHDKSADVSDLGSGKAGTDLGDAPVAEAYVCDGVEPLRRINDPPPAKNKIKRHCGPHHVWLDVAASWAPVGFVGPPSFNVSPRSLGVPGQTNLAASAKRLYRRIGKREARERLSQMDRRLEGSVANTSEEVVVLTAERIVVRSHTEVGGTSIAVEMKRFPDGQLDAASLAHDFKAVGRQVPIHEGPCGAQVADDLRRCHRRRSSHRSESATLRASRSDALERRFRHPLREVNVVNQSHQDRIDIGVSDRVRTRLCSGANSYRLASQAGRTARRP